MSGGHFNYKQYHIQEILESIQEELNSQGKPKDKEELWNDKEYYVNYPEEKFNRTYPKEIQDRFKEAIKHLKLAHIYAQRIDWFLSGDDGEESFLTRLKEELDEIKLKNQVVKK